MDYQTIAPILDDLTSQIVNNNTVGLMLVGSYARGTASAWSDIDLTHFVNDHPNTEPNFWLHEGYSISLLESRIPQREGLFSNPQSAIYAIPMWRSAHIFIDKTGKLANLQKAANEFQWEAIQDTANQYVSYALYRKAEEIPSLIGAVLENDPYAILTLSGFVLNWLTTAVAMRYGILTQSEKTLLHQLHDHFGDSHEWSRLLQVYADGNVSASERGTAIILLYQRTAEMMADVILKEHRMLVDYALDKIEQVKPTLPAI